MDLQVLFCGKNRHYHTCYCRCCDWIQETFGNHSTDHRRGLLYGTGYSSFRVCRLGRECSCLHLKRGIMVFSVRMVSDTRTSTVQQNIRTDTNALRLSIPTALSRRSTDNTSYHLPTHHIHKQVFVPTDIRAPWHFS